MSDLRLVLRVVDEDGAPLFGRWTKTSPQVGWTLSNHMERPDFINVLVNSSPDEMKTLLATLGKFKVVRVEVASRAVVYNDRNSLRSWAHDWTEYLHLTVRRVPSKYDDWVLEAQRVKP